MERPKRQRKQPNKDKDTLQINAKTNQKRQKIQENTTEGEFRLTEDNLNQHREGRQMSKGQAKSRLQKKENDRINVLYRMIRRTVGTLSAKLNEISNEVKNNRQEVSESSEQEDEALTQATTSAVVPMRSEEGVESNTERTWEQENAVEDKRVTYLVKNVSTEKPKFNGIKEPNRKVHPVTFLEDLEIYLGKVAKDSNEIDLILECLTDDARDWARIYKSRWNSLKDFKEDFLATYWGKNEQNELRRKIVQGVWDRKQNPSMLNHFLKIVGKAQALTYKIEEDQLVTDIIRHYPKFVQQGWHTSKINTIMETAEYLRVLDDVNNQEQHVYSPPPSAQEKEVQKRRREFQQEYTKWKRPSKSKQANIINVELENSVN